MGGKTDPDLNPEVEAIPELSESWMAEMVDCGRYARVPPDRELWTRSIEYEHYPFDYPLTQAFAVGVDKPEFLVCNTGNRLYTTQIEEIRGTYQWFYQRIRSNLFDEPADLILGGHLSQTFDASLGRKRKILGMYDGEQPRPLISINSEVFGGGLEVERARYQVLLDRGYSLAEIIATHETAHKTVQPYSPQEEEFARFAGWIINHFEIERDGEKRETTSYRLKSGVAESPPTPYGTIEPSEDWPDSVVYFRLAPDLLGDYHYLAVKRLLREKLLEHGQYYPPNFRVRMLALPKPIYPLWDI